MRKYDALVVAGGFGTRMKTGRPKSLLSFWGRPMLWWTIVSLREAGIENILVATNRKEYLIETKINLGGFNRCDVVIDGGFSSTYMIMNSLIDEFDRRFLFTYGHAPRPPSLYSEIWESKSLLAACRFDKTTKRNRIELNQRFLEPPFVLDRDSVKIGTETNWADFFLKRLDITDLVDVSGEGEFNSSDELLRYRAYLQTVMPNGISPSTRPSQNL